MKMNIYKFINSPDVRAHCEKRQPVFDTYQKTIIVAHSHRPLEEKLKAYEALAYLYPDTSFCWDVAYEEKSICDFIKKQLRKMEKAKGAAEDLIGRHFINHRIIAPLPFKQNDLVADINAPNTPLVYTEDIRCNCLNLIYFDPEKTDRPKEARELLDAWNNYRKQQRSKRLNSVTIANIKE